MNSKITLPHNHIKPSQRMSHIQPYFFKAQDELIAKLVSSGKEIIRLDVGSPDLPPTPCIIEALISQVTLPDQHGYMPHGGTKALREAICQYYFNRFNVSLNPQTEVLAVLGSKEGLFHLSQAYLEAGDISLVPDPGYPVYANSSLIAGASVYAFPLLLQNNYLPDLAQISKNVLKNAKMLWLNYPNNPTGATASLDFFEQAVHFCHSHQILLVHDAAYADVYYDGYHPPSIFQIPGAKETAIEFASLSKTYNMAGWRIGMAVGNECNIAALSNYKSQADSSTFAPIMYAAKVALISDQSWIQKRNLVYQKRRDTAVKLLSESGLALSSPKAAIYLWAKVPENYPNSADFCHHVLENIGVSLTPGIVYGAYGEGYFRIALTVKDELFEKGICRLAEFIKTKP